MLSQQLGARVRRREDPRLVTGGATYVEDQPMPRVAHLFFVRSYLAHAHLKHVETSKALAAPGVIRVFTADDLRGMPLFPLTAPEGTRIPPRPLLNGNRLHFAGDLIAIVVAETREEAADAADLVTVDTEPLPAVVDPDQARSTDAPVIHESLGTNVAFEWRRTNGDVDGAFAGAHQVIRTRIRNQRVTGLPIEPRAILASSNQWGGSITMWCSTQIPHAVRDEVAAFLGLRQASVRVIAPEVGGGFGAKLSIYPEDLLVPWCAMQIGRPVKWVEERSEHMVGTTHGRDHIQDAELAVDSNGRLRGLRVKMLVDLGAFPMGAQLVRTTARLISGCYELPALQVDAAGVYTNKTPIAAYRGAGRPEAIFLIERLMDLAARSLDIDPAEIRRRNLMPRFHTPKSNIAGETYDSGDYPAALELALETAGYARLRAEQKAARSSGGLLGIGISCYVEMAGFGPEGGLFESATVRAHPDGKVTVVTGTSPHGQGHETAWAQIVAAQLGIGLDDVTVLHGDTSAVPIGVGTFGSRSAAVGGVAVHLASIAVQNKARLIASHLLEASKEDVVPHGGRFNVRGVPSRSVSFAEVARAAYTQVLSPDLEPGLEATRFFQPKALGFPFGAHVAVVRVDSETGAVQLTRYVSVDDCGRVLNPLLAEGQVHGGLAMGIAQALLEEIVYGPGGELLTGNLTTYLAPTASDLPSFTLDRTVTASTVNPLGVKGIGEAATIGSTPAVVNAVLDALTPYGITTIDPPCTPEKVWKAMRASASKSQL
jgi:aerobic carbon-monoxide dehydrogenase large subunit